MRKMTGGPISESTEKEWPELAKQWAAAEVNMPKETSMVDRVGPMGPVEQKLTGGANARTNFGRISINRNNVTLDNSLRDTLVHELTHAAQPHRGLIQYMKDMFTPWDKIPYEQEAIQAEQNYPWKEVRSDRKLKYPDPGRK